MLTGILTSAPTGTVTLAAVDSVTLSVGDNFSNLARRPIGSPSAASAWNTNQGIIPARVDLISLEGDVTNGTASVGSLVSGTGIFITYPDQNGTVNMLASESVVLNAGFQLSDFTPTTLPTLNNIAAILAPFQTEVTSSNYLGTTLAPGYDRLMLTGVSGRRSFVGGANYLAGQDTGYTYVSGLFKQHHDLLEGDSPQQLMVGLSLFSPDVIAPSLEAERHAGLHDGSDPARIIALNGDVTETAIGFFQVSQGTLPSGQLDGVFTPSVIQDIIDPYINVTKAIQIYAGRDVKNLALLGQNNDASDVTIISAGRDVIYTALPLVAGTFQQEYGIYVGGPGNVLIQSGRNVDLGTSTGIQRHR